MLHVISYQVEDSIDRLHDYLEEKEIGEEDRSSVIVSKCTPMPERIRK